MTMGGFEQIYQDKASKKDDGNDGQHDQWAIMEGNNDISDSESSFENSTSSTVSSSSSDLIEDAASSTSSFSSNGPLYELSELMAQLPIKRGLSKYYHGKSQTFASLACVESLEDLAKKGRPSCRRKMKSCKSYGGGLDNHSTYSPKATISKKSSRVFFLSSLGSRGALFSSCRHPIPVQKNL